MKGVLCPECGRKSSRLLDSRDVTDGRRRRRECVSCGHRFSTVEMVATMKRGLHRGEKAGRKGHRTFRIPESSDGS